MRNCHRILLLLAALLIARSALAQDKPILIGISGAWVRAVPPSVDDTAAFMLIKNPSDHPLRLLGGSAPFAAMGMPMETTHKTVQGVEVEGMKAVDYLEIPAHGELTLKPGGDHLMLMTLKSHPRAGDTVTVTLDFDLGEGKIEIPMQMTVQMAVKVDQE
jgi:copper(I)-binding protein